MPQIRFGVRIHAHMTWNMCAYTTRCKTDTKQCQNLQNSYKKNVRTQFDRYTYRWIYPMLKTHCIHALNVGIGSIWVCLVPLQVLSLATVDCRTQNRIIPMLPLRLRLRSNQINIFDWTNMNILIPIGQEYVFCFLHGHLRQCRLSWLVAQVGHARASFWEKIAHLLSRQKSVWVAVS